MDIKLQHPTSYPRSVNASMLTYSWGFIILVTTSSGISRWCAWTFADIELTFMIIPPFYLDSSSSLAPQIVCRPTSSGSSLNSIHRLRLRRAVRYLSSYYHFYIHYTLPLFRIPTSFMTIWIFLWSFLPNWAFFPHLPYSQYLFLTT